MPALRPEDPTKLGDWTLTRRIAEGGAGKVFQGVRGVDDSENAAIKVLKDDSFDVVATQEYLKREIAALKAIDHENVAKFIEANFEAGEMWLATEYVHGQNLETYLKQNRGAITELRWFQIAENIFNGLVAVHSHNIIHRDISPKNIMLSDQTKVAKIIDFGISFVPTFTEFSQRTSFEGSRLFAAPENITLRDDPKMDVFSAAVTLAYVAKGSSIWKGETKGEISNSIMKEAPNLEGLKENQIDFLKPLLAKFPMERSSSEEAHKNALKYLEYLVDQENRNKPRTFSPRKIFARLRRKSSLKWGIPISLIGASALLLISMWSTNQAEVLPSIEPTASPATTPTIIESPAAVPAEGDGKEKNIKLAQCLNLTATDYKKALENCLLVSNQGDGMATYQVAYIYDVYLSDQSKAKIYYQKAVDLGYIDGYVGLGSLLMEQKKYSDAIVLLLKAEKLGSKNSSNLIGMSYEKMKKYDLALKYYLISSDAGEVLSAYNAAVIYQSKSDIDNAIKYFQIAANKNDAPSMYALGEIFRLQKKDSKTSCTWYNRGSKAGDVPSQNAVKNFCQDDFKLSSPEASNVKIEQLNYRPFLGDSAFYFIWAGLPDKLLDYTGVQVRERERSDVPWFQVPHKLQSEKDGTYALVDQLFLAVITKRTNICWDFRIVQEVDGKLVRIWNYLPLSGCAN